MREPDQGGAGNSNDPTIVGRSGDHAVWALERRDVRVASWVLFATAEIWTLLFLARAAWFNDAYKKVWAELVVPLPYFTILAVSPVYTYSLVVLGIGGAVQQIRVRRPASALVWNAAHVASVAILTELHRWALVLPLTATMDVLTAP